MFRWLRARERGQVLMITALITPVLLGMAGMAIDIGGYADDKRTLQNAADAVALAAAQDLCKPDCASTSQAVATGQAWAAKNNIPASNVTIVITGAGAAPRVTATVKKNHRFYFVRVIGIDNKDVSARAAAVKASFGGGAGIVPWTVTQATIDAAAVGAEVVMKYDSTGANVGNFGAIRIDGPGSSVYNSSVMFGSNTVACAETAANCTTGACPGSYPDGCAETAPECDGPDCTPQTGNLIGPTRTGVDFRINNTLASCDSFVEVFKPAAASSYTLNPDCNPYIDGPGKCLTPTSVCSRRVIIIPVVDSFGNGASDPTTIQRFALVFLEGYDAGKCQGNSCEIKGRFVKADLTTGALAGSYDPTALVHFVKLVE